MIIERRIKMNREQTKIIIALISSNYSSYKTQDDALLEVRLNTIYESFKDMPYESVYNATMLAINRCKYPPTIADIRENLENMYDTYLNEYVAWEVLYSHIQHGNDYTQGDFNTLPQEIRDVVKDGRKIREWARSSCDFIDKHVKPSFLKEYRALVASNKNKQLITSLNENRLQIVNNGANNDEESN